MPRLSVKAPKYRLHKPSGQAVVTLNGRDVYLGAYGSPESKARYNQLVAGWQRSGRTSPIQKNHAAKSVTIDEMLVAYMGHVEQYDLKNGKPTIAQEEARRLLTPIHERYGASSPADSREIACCPIAAARQ